MIFLIVVIYFVIILQDIFLPFGPTSDETCLVRLLVEYNLTLKFEFFECLIYIPHICRMFLIIRIIEVEIQKVHLKTSKYRPRIVPPCVHANSFDTVSLPDPLSQRLNI